MKTIPLTQDQVALVDDWRYEELNQWKWHARWSENTQSYYAERNEGDAGSGKKKIQMSRQIMNTPEGMECDHRNRNTLDNQEHNLRNATPSQNRMNKRTYSSNKLGEKCIGRDGKSYRVRVKKDKKVVFSKSYNTLEEAVASRNAALTQFHGEYAYLGKS